MTNLTLYHDDGSETPVPFKWCICRGCEGSGKSSAYLGAFTREDLDEQGHEFCEDYFSGRYDRACDRCEGTGKVRIADRKAMDRAALALWDEQRRDEAEYRACQAAERRMGA